MQVLTSLTLLNITHVLHHYYPTGIAKYEVKWVSQAAASQRSGRAGRTGPGHCYRLYSANFYHEYLQPYQPPEITVTPLEELILQVSVRLMLSAVHISSGRVCLILFPY